MAFNVPNSFSVSEAIKGDLGRILNDIGHHKICMQDMFKRTEASEISKEAVDVIVCGKLCRTSLEFPVELIQEVLRRRISWVQDPNHQWKFTWGLYDEWTQYSWMVDLLIIESVISKHSEQLIETIEEILRENMENMNNSQFFEFFTTNNLVPRSYGFSVSWLSEVYKLAKVFDLTRAPYLKWYGTALTFLRIEETSNPKTGFAEYHLHIRRDEIVESSILHTSIGFCNLSMYEYDCGIFGSSKHGSHLPMKRFRDWVSCLLGIPEPGLPMRQSVVYRRAPGKRSKFVPDEEYDTDEEPYMKKSLTSKKYEMYEVKQGTDDSDAEYNDGDSDYYDERPVPRRLDFGNDYENV